jgi:hypothetical protein
MQSTSLLDQQNAVETAIAQFCEDARARVKRCRDFASKRQFLFDHVEKVTFINDKDHHPRICGPQAHCHKP